MISPYALGGIIVGTVIILGGDAWFSYNAGYNKEKSVIEQMVADATQKAADAQKAQDTISLKAAVDAAQHQVEIHTVTQTITKRIPVYVAKTDACPVSPNYVRLWNDAVAGTDTLSAPAIKPNDAASTNAAAH